MRISTTGSCSNLRIPGHLPLCPSDNNAFTLLELIVVMVLITIATSLAVPQISSFLYTDKLKSSARKLVGLINQSSQLAQRQQIPYVLKYSSRERKFVVEPEKKSEEKKKQNNEGELQLTGTVTVRDLWSYYRGVRNGEEFTLRFNSSGYTEPAIIHLRESETKELSMLIPPFVGKIQIVDKYLSPDDEKLFQ